MGCNQSKQEDIKTDNEQRQRTAPQPAASQSTPSRSIASSAPNDQNNNMMLGMSYTDQKDNEHGYFKDIVDRTAHNFIDVSVTGLPMEKEAPKAHSKDFSGSLFDPKDFDTKAYGLPNPSATHQYQPVKNTLSQPTTPQLVEFVTSTNHSIVAGLKAMHVNDVGEIVTNFPDIN
eukprot:Phypoly_transcript_21810.p1 GENE.Phypoly_transcript_21810~~Phypoly_transcript_21810.p1  ORF type:complete len:174 (+),score=32.77 Phypoly_transcript_21810:61-582(+)